MASLTQLERLKVRLGIELRDTSRDDLLTDFLATGYAAIMSCRYPYTDDWPKDLDRRYEEKQIMIAVDLYNKQGAEGQLSHSENGISRSYQSSWISKDLLADIVPVCGVVK